MTARKLFFLRENAYLPEGTLVELADADPLTVPDGGSGASFICGRDAVIECPPFAENVPPGQGPVVVTSLTKEGEPGDASELRFEQDIHRQVIEIPFEIESVIITDRVTGNEADSYFPSDNGPFTMHVGHLRPGFYLAETAGPAGRSAFTFIKFFPPRFSEPYATHLAEAVCPELTPPAGEGGGSSERTRLLNKALELATEWGENFLKPIHDRLRVFYPELTDPEIDALVVEVRAAESVVYRLADEAARGLASDDDVKYAAMNEVAWMSYENASRLANIGGYYARR